jgi:hypothetical protein
LRFGGGFLYLTALGNDTSIGHYG